MRLFSAQMRQIRKNALKMRSGEKGYRHLLYLQEMYQLRLSCANFNNYFKNKFKIVQLRPNLTFDTAI